MLKTQSIQAFLTNATHPDLARLYNPNMEVQVNVAQDNGELIQGEYMGKQWRGWTDGLTVWKAIRIPYKANSEPEYKDSEIKFDLAGHAEGIGMTGWDWVNKVSKWVAFDFDAIVGHADAHKKKLTPAELEEVTDRVREIPWVTIRKSTSGNGLHLYVFTPDVSTATHTEHAALGRAILGVMSALTGCNFESKVDVCGQNMWVWHRKMKGTDGLSLLREGEMIPEDMIPINWTDHIKVVKGKRARTLPASLEGTAAEDPFLSLTAKKANINLDDEHRRHIQWLADNNAIWWWDDDNHMLVTHTVHLKAMHKELELYGLYDTFSSHSSPHNCFLFPLRNGAWSVRRYGLGVNEAPCWSQDGEGWTRTYFNKPPTIDSACRGIGGVENLKGEFEFLQAEDAQKVVTVLGANIAFDPKLTARGASIKKHKDGRLIFTIKREDADKVVGMESWSLEKNKYVKIVNIANTEVAEPEANTYDDIVRHLVSESGDDAGWMINTDNNWHSEPLQHIRMALQSFGMPVKEVNVILGSSVVNCWHIVNKPFKPEYPGGREWNLHSVQLAFEISDPTGVLRYPTWLSILDHCGKGINDAVKENPWCKANGVSTGAEYLKCWIASMLQDPYRHLPYLFFYSREENTGKSTFYESIARLMTVHGHAKATDALKNKSGFNGELHGAILCTIEEENLNSKENKEAYARVKNWVTARELSIHPKGGTPYHVPNTTHWVQCANDHSYCPIFTGDTRITMIQVSPIDPLSMIPAKEMDTRLDKEAPDFLSALLNMEIPYCPDRLGIPALDTSEKQFVQSQNMDELQQFIMEKCEVSYGSLVKYSDFYDAFTKWLPKDSRGEWSQIRVGRSFAPETPKGRHRRDSQFYIGNLKWRTDPDPEANTIIVLNGKFLDAKPRT